MTETVLATDDLDAFIRERVDQVLITSCCNSDRIIHVLSEDEWMDPVCNATIRRGEWLDKPISIYPEDYHDVCPDCVETRFGVEVVSE